MIIEAFEVIRFEIPLRDPFRTGFGVIDKKSGVVVRLQSEGLSGWGEGSPLSAPIYVPEYDIETFEVLKRFIGPSIVGKSFGAARELLDSIAFVRGHNFARTAVETAFWDLAAQRSGRSLKEMIGGKAAAVPVGESIGICVDIDSLLEAVSKSLHEGYQRIKIKIRPGWDIEPVREIRRAFGQIALMVDANSSYTRNDLPVLRALDEFGLMMIEQPLGYDDIIDHAAIQAELETSICLDESILSASDARKAIEIGACRIVNIKPGRVGGIDESIRIHDTCRAAGIPVWCGGLFESSIGRFFNLTIASLPGFTLPADMTPPPVLFEEDLVRNPFTVVNGHVTVPSALSIFDVDEEKVAFYARDRWIWQPKDGRVSL
jgi:O-succinylbenzoate synthase